MAARNMSIGPLRSMIVMLLAGIAGAMVAAGAAQALELVTPQEAALPPDKLPNLVYQGSPTRRPTVTVVSPALNAGVVHSPVDLKMTFEAHGGAKIDPD